MAVGAAVGAGLYRIISQPSRVTQPSHKEGTVDKNVLQQMLRAFGHTLQLLGAQESAGVGAEVGTVGAAVGAEVGAVLGTAV